MLEKKIKKKSLSDFKVTQSFLIEYQDKRDKLIVICHKCHSSYDYYKQDVCPKCNTKIKDKSLLSFSKDEEYRVFSGDALEPSNDIINEIDVHEMCNESLYSERVEETDTKIKYSRTYFRGYKLRLSKKQRFYTAPYFRTELTYFDKRTGYVIKGGKGPLYTMDILEDADIYHLTTNVKSNLNKYFVNGIVNYIEHQYPIVKRLESYVDFNQNIPFDKKRPYIIDLIRYYQYPIFLQLFENIDDDIVSFDYINSYFIHFMSSQQRDKLKKSKSLADYVEMYSGSPKVFDYILHDTFFKNCCNASVFEYIINISKLIILSPLFFYLNDDQYNQLFDDFKEEGGINYFYVSYYHNMNSIFTDYNYDRSVNHFQYVNKQAVQYLSKINLCHHFSQLVFNELIEYNEDNDSGGVAQLLFKFEKISRLIIPAIHYLNQTKQKEISNILSNTISFNDFYKESIKYLVRDYALIVEINNVCFLQVPNQSRTPICKNYDVDKLLNVIDIDIFYDDGIERDSYVYIIADHFLDSLYVTNENKYSNRILDFYWNSKMHRFVRRQEPESRKIENSLIQYLFITNQL